MKEMYVFKAKQLVLSQLAMAEIGAKTSGPREFTCIDH